MKNVFILIELSDFMELSAYDDVYFLFISHWDLPCGYCLPHWQMWGKVKNLL